MSKNTEAKAMDSAAREERIRALAYQIWEDEGRPEGRAEAHWEQACLIMMDIDAKTPEWLSRQTDKADEAARADGQKRVEELAARSLRRSAA